MPVSQVLAVTFTTPTRGLLLGVRGTRTVLAESVDGGQRWTQVAHAQ